MSDKSIAERQRDIAVEALRTIARVDEHGILISQARAFATHKLSLIAALDAPPQPDLAEIGQEACRAFLLRDGDRSFGFNDEFKPMLMAAYTAMRAADEAGRRRDVEADPRVRELREAAHAFLPAALHFLPSHVQEDRRKRLRAALATFEKEAKP